MSSFQASTVSAEDSFSLSTNLRTILVLREFFLTFDASVLAPIASYPFCNARGRPYGVEMVQFQQQVLVPHDTLLPARSDFIITLIMVVVKRFFYSSCEPSPAGIPLSSIS